jgi:hypothetical protein
LPAWPAKSAAAESGVVSVLLVHRQGLCAVRLLRERMARHPRQREEVLGRDPRCGDDRHVAAGGEQRWDGAAPAGGGHDRPRADLVDERLTSTSSVAG